MEREGRERMMMRDGERGGEGMMICDGERGMWIVCVRGGLPVF